jgi:oligo-1,6-glucosidase
VLNYYKKLINVRRNSPALLKGKYIPLNNADANVLAYAREYAGKRILVALNMSRQTQTVAYSIGSKAKTLISSDASTSTNVDLKIFTLKPYQSFVGEVEE